MALRGRVAGFTMSNEHRDKIKKSNILNALLEHVNGKREMSATQVTAGLGLLKKCLPDLAAVELSGDPERPVAIAWLDQTLSASHTPQDNSSYPSIIENNASPASCVTAEPEKQ